VHNGCINYIGRILKNKRTINETELAIPLSEIISPVSTEYPTANLAVQELQAAIEKAVNALPDHCREIFILSRIHNKSHNEIAEKLGISVNTVKVQIYRALLKLKIDLKDYLPIILLIFGNHLSQN
jgi:RNA polymerase sigma-70 factor (ECF subfamily)